MEVKTLCKVAETYDNQLFMSFLLSHWPVNSVFPRTLTFQSSKQITASIIYLKFTCQINISSICL